MSVELAEKIILGMNSKARIDEVMDDFGKSRQDIKKVFDLLSMMGFVEIKGEFIVITEKGQKFRELPSPQVQGI